MNKFDKIALEIKHSDFIDFIVIEAQDIWSKYGSDDDFCLQSVGDEVIIFGAMNRVKYTIKKGFECIESNCTKKFIETFNEIFN